MTLSRRALLRAGGGAVLGVAWPIRGALPAEGRMIEKRLVAGPGQAALAGAAYPKTAVWCYDGSVPGPEIRLRQGERIRVVAGNRLPKDTTIHWHGVRVPNPMDGAPYVTQPPIQPGESFTYEFTVPDAGTYWYHPHAHSAEEVGRGLMGAFVIEEPEPPPVDRDLVWVLGDFRLREDASIVGGFDNPMEMSMAGRVGNTVTINGQVVPDRIAVRRGERIRLRLINAAAARIFGLEFRGHHPLVVAYDGQPVEPHAPEGGRVILGPAMRTDLVLDMTASGNTAPVIDSFYERLSYKLVELSYTDEPPLRAQPLAPPAKLPANTMPEPDIANAHRHEVTLTGGMMGGMGMGGGMGIGGGGMMGSGAMWAINGVAMPAGDMRHMKPILTLTRGKTYILAIENKTAWYHPIHLHGHSFRVITRNGRSTKYREWRDTVLLPPRERAEIAFVADNPGDWMFHCHILAHQDGGMMSVIRVT
jgi:FtsP/CotA-like multicopper oxidase with cupredoxin domain